MNVDKHNQRLLMENGYEPYPPYYKVLKAKKNCSPAENSITITDIIAQNKITMPALSHLQKTSART